MYRASNTAGSILYRAERIGPDFRESIIKISRNRSGALDYYIDPNGYAVNLVERNRCRIPVRRDTESLTEIDARALQALSEIKTFGERNGIAITFATPPLYETVLDSLDNAVIETQKKKLISVLGGFHDFLFYGQPLAVCENFDDPNHLNKTGIGKYLQLIRSGAYYTGTPKPIGKSPGAGAASHDDTTVAPRPYSPPSASPQPSSSTSIN